MGSPFPPSTSAPGAGQMVVQLLPYGVSALAKMTFQYPLKLISPSPTAEQKSVLVFLLTYGGGLVGGDQVHLKVNVNPNAKLSIVTQGHTKIFKSPSRDVVTRQRLDVTVESRAGVCLLPDPVQPFDGSVYEQRQVFTLAESASLCLLDWVSAGRTARGENWGFRAWSGRNEVWIAATDTCRARLLLRDNVMLEDVLRSSQNNSVREKMQNMGIFGTLVLRGPETESLSAFFFNEFSALPRIGGRDFRSQETKDQDGESPLSELEIWRAQRLNQEKDDALLWSAAKVRGCMVVKFGARTVEGGRTWIGSMIKQEASISRIFGEDSIMCVR